jgi:subtilisin family serine protease
VTFPRPTRRALVVGIGLATVAAMVGIGTNALAGTSDPVSPSGASPAIKHPAKTKALQSKKSKGATVKNSYIVVLKDKKATKSAVHSQSASLSAAFGGKVDHEYSHALRGYAATMTPAQAKRLAADSRVALVEPNRVIKAADTQTNPPSWGLDRIDQTFFPLSKTYSPPTSGAGVTAYVIDTGIRITHNEFATNGVSRASYGFDFIDNDAVADDCEGHGTHVAGTIGGNTYGVAKSVNLVAVRVLDCAGSGTTDGVIAGIEWVTANAVKPAVANMSIEGGIDAALDAAVEASVASGVTYAVAAGNDADDACNYSPAATPGAITVGATNIADFRADFSNFGSCVDIFAPGMSITSAFNTSNSATATEGGTSMASPHVAGAAALLLAANPALTPAEVAADITGSAVPMAVHFPAGSPNRLLNVNGTGTSTTFGLHSHANNLFVTADPAGTSPLIANRYLIGGWELFDVVPADSGYVALKARSNGKFVTADLAGAKPLVAKATSVGAWEQFKIITDANGSIALQARINGKYVTADNGGKSGLIANRTSIGGWETFDRSGPAAVVSFKAGANGRFVTADNAGAKPLIANRTSAGGWEVFDVIDMLDGYVALRSHANGKWVTADPAGTKPLIANRTAVGGWEQFYWFAWTGTQSTFIALSNFDWVTAENGGKNPLINNRLVFDSNGNFLPPGGWQIFYVA